MVLAIRFYLMGTHVQIGDVIGKTLAGFLFFQYAPLILFFPSLYSNSQKQNDIVVRNRLATFYLIFITRFFIVVKSGRPCKQCSMLLTVLLLCG
jgi:hypothetical protein